MIPKHRRKHLGIIIIPAIPHTSQIRFVVLPYGRPILRTVLTAVHLPIRQVDIKRVTSIHTLIFEVSELPVDAKRVKLLASTAFEDICEGWTAEAGVILFAHAGYAREDAFLAQAFVVGAVALPAFQAFVDCLAYVDGASGF
jgi:hypothetical protein